MKISKKHFYLSILVLALSSLSLAAITDAFSIPVTSEDVQHIGAQFMKRSTTHARERAKETFEKVKDINEKDFPTDKVKDFMESGADVAHDAFESIEEDMHAVSLDIEKKAVRLKNKARERRPLLPGTSMRRVIKNYSKNTELRPSAQVKVRERKLEQHTLNRVEKIQEYISNETHDVTDVTQKAIMNKLRSSEQFEHHITPGQPNSALNIKDTK